MSRPKTTTGSSEHNSSVVTLRLTTEARRMLEETSEATGIPMAEIASAVIQREFLANSGWERLKQKREEWQKIKDETFAAIGQYRDS